MYFLPDLSIVSLVVVDRNTFMNRLGLGIACGRCSPGHEQAQKRTSWLQRAVSMEKTPVDIICWRYHTRVSHLPAPLLVDSCAPSPLQTKSIACVSSCSICLLLRWGLNLVGTVSHLVCDLVSSIVHVLEGLLVLSVLSTEAHIADKDCCDAEGCASTLKRSELRARL